MVVGDGAVVVGAAVEGTPGVVGIGVATCCCVVGAGDDDLGAAGDDVGAAGDDVGAAGDDTPGAAGCT